jgi:glycosyltransferase involved in cell wall biosynthesis
MIDSIAFQHPQTDRAQVWRHLLEEWSQTDFARHLLVLDRGGWTPRFPGLATRLIAPCEGANAPAQRYFLERYAIEEAASLFISSGDTTPLTVPAVHMVYDRVAEASNLDPKAALERRTALDHARHYICLSPSIAATLARLYPDSVGRTTVAPPGVAASFHPLSEEDRQTVRAQIGAPQGFFLLVDGFGLHKNAEVLVQALARMPEAERLPIVYAPRASTAPEELPVMPEGTKMILIQGEEDARVRLYNAGTVLVLPSPDEEMPLALLEAMACGCPVVTCDLPGLREQGGDGASYFTPRDPDSLISVLRATRNPDSRTTPGAAARTRATRFTWSRMADIVRGVLEREASAANGP